jgi:hypothetical protein
VQLHDWTHASALIGHLGALGVDIAVVPGVAVALCKAIAKLVDPLFQGLYPNGMNASITPKNSVIPSIQYALIILGPTLLFNHSTHCYFLEMHQA